MFYKAFLKRPLDLLVSTIAILICAIPMLCIGFALWSCGYRPVLFRQVRIGKEGRSFVIYKFRTMSETKGEDGKMLPDEKRLGKLGLYLRAWSLDEIPQLLNVLKGEMSLVGPRPLLPAYLARYSEIQARRHEVLPGITGLAQVSGRNALTWKEKFEFDVKYVDEVTLLGDLTVIFRTVLRLLKRDGISSPGSATVSEFLGND